MPFRNEKKYKLEKNGQETQNLILKIKITDSHPITSQNDWKLFSITFNSKYCNSAKICQIKSKQGVSHRQIRYKMTDRLADKRVDAHI